MSEPADRQSERRPPPTDGKGRRSRIWLTALFIGLTLVVADRVAWWLAPPRHLREVEDAIADLRRSDPTVLAIGSSHARTFAVLDDSLIARTAGRERVLAVPVEWGKLSSYRWVLERRVLPLLDERDGTGAPARSALRRAIIVTEWWDSCLGADLPPNLPARAWRWGDFVADVRAHGLTTYNQSFLANRWTRFWRQSALVQDRGHNRIISAARQRVVPSSVKVVQDNFQRQATEWQQMVEEGERCIGAPAEMGALTAMLDTLQARGLEVTVLLYPRMPVTLTERARATTLPAFAARIASVTAPRGIRVVDLTSNAPLTDADFGGDFDHILPAGNARLSGWMLDGPLAFLKEPVRR